MKRKDPVSLYLGKRKLGGDVYDKAADVGMKDSDSPVAQAVLHRLIRQHPDVIGKYGPDKVMDAVDQIAYFVGDVEEIGSSDVSIWTKEVIDELEAMISEAKLNIKKIHKAVDDGKSMDVIVGMFADKGTTNTDEIRKIVRDYKWKKRMKEEVELNEGDKALAAYKAQQLQQTGNTFGGAKLDDIGQLSPSTKKLAQNLKTKAVGPGKNRNIMPWHVAKPDIKGVMNQPGAADFNESPDDPERRPNHVVSISHKNDGTTRIRQLGEGLNKDDIKDRVQPTVHFDEFVPKMGTEDNVIVSSFRILGEAPAKDLENFLEKGYSWILDAETSAGEIDPGYFVVFVEAERRTSFPEKFYSMLGDIYNITDIKPTEWVMKYYQGSRRDPKYKLTVQNMITHIPLSPRKYRQHKASESVFESMLNIARIPRKKGDTHEFRTIAKRSRT